MTEIKKLVKYDIRAPGVFWGHSTGDLAILRFTHASKRVAKDGTITIAGDGAEAHNAIGNWVRVNYTCTFDPGTDIVTHATLAPGRLP
jgi:hypothetical protein